MNLSASLRIVAVVVISINILPTHVSASVTTWGGSNNNWSNPANWSNGLPTSGNDGIINSGSPSADQDLPGGETITVNSGVTVNSTADTTPVFDMHGGTYRFVFSNNLNGGMVLSSDSSVSTQFNGTINGFISGASHLSADVNIPNSGTLFLNGDGSAWNGGLIVQAGHVAMITATGAGTGAIQINSTGIFSYYYSNGTLANAITGTGKVQVDPYSHTVVFHGDTITPGDTPGSVGTLTLDSAGDNSIFSYSANGGTNAKLSLVLDSSASYSSLNYLGRVDLTNLDLAATLNYVPTFGDKMFILTNDAADPITGNFTGLAEGSTVTLGSYTAKITYVADSGSNSLTGGNDVALFNFTHVPEPTSLSLFGLLGIGLLRRRRHAR